ncbi:hypothetical protein EDB82DRAFT_508169 [Fusarium venenatum]|uniref:uncharacterized protein n=1 Tax=Fusarium venenatum TaxID=56646 RepID=UPI001D72AB67|nr:hypothetical protein EDB82DRAFT_508169 [Fusarium venenatum]
MKPISRSLTVICDYCSVFLAHDTLSNTISADRAANQPTRKTLLFLMLVLRYFVLRAPLGAVPSRVDTSFHFVKQASAVCNQPRRNQVCGWKRCSKRLAWVFMIIFTQWIRYLFVALKRNRKVYDT